MDRGKGHPATRRQTGHTRLFSSYSYRKHGRGFQPVRGLERALENGHANRIFRDRFDGGFGSALEK